MIEEFIARWELVPAGDPVVTRSSMLARVTWRGRPAVLKLALIEEERRGAALMEWWAGEGAGAVLRREGNALLLERAEGGDLTGMADDQATHVICDVAARLHAPRNRPAPELMPLAQWFRALETAAAERGGILAQCAGIARELLAVQEQVVLQHGDLHHGNVLDFGEQGWLAIDPKGLIGERAFDYANLFFNPAQALAKEAFIRRLYQVSTHAGLDRLRLLRWIVAWGGLSAAFSIEDGDPPEDALEIAGLALAQLRA
jgi:streptomycin 6-kinase